MVIILFLEINRKLYAHGKTGSKFDENDMTWKDTIGMESLSNEELLRLWRDCASEHNVDHRAVLLFTGYMSRVWEAIRSNKTALTSGTIALLKKYANNILDVDVLCEIMIEADTE